MTRPDGRKSEEAIRAALDPQEQLLWLGGPDPAKRIGPNDIPISLVGLVFCLGAVMAMLDHEFSGALLWLPLLLLLVGLFLLAGRFPIKARAKARTRYGLTDQRALFARQQAPLHSVQLEGVRVGVERTRGGQHLIVDFSDGTQWRTHGNIRMDNTGIDDLFGMPRPPVFWDVHDAPALRHALETAAQRSGCTVRHLEP